MHLHFLTMTMFQSQHTSSEPLSQWVHQIMLIILASPRQLALKASIILQWCCSKMQVRYHQLSLWYHHPILVEGVICCTTTMLVLLESHLLDLVYLLTCCFHQKIVLLSIPILTRLEKEHLSCLNFASIGYAHDYLRHNHY